ncbi:MAG TPA: SpoIIE family protein phosphatase [Streptomyces sp.]
MPSHLFADRPAPQPPEREAVDALISRTLRLRGDMDAVRRDAAVTDEDDPQVRWQRALCDLAVHHLDDLGRHLGQLKEGLGGPPEDTTEAAVAPEPRPGSLLNRVGSAEWNLLTDEADWSDELYRIFGRAPGAGPMSLDELPSVLLVEDQPLLTSMVTNCLIDGKPMDGEFRILRPDGRMRTLHMMGEPVLDTEGRTASMWAVVRDVSELRRSQHLVGRTHNSVLHTQHLKQNRHRVAVELQEAVLPPWRGPLRSGGQEPGRLDIAARYLPAGSSELIGGDWYDALELPDGRTLLTVGDLTGHGVPATSAMAMLLGAVRGMAMAGLEPGPLMGHLNQLLTSPVQPAIGGAVCCRFDPATSTLTWAQAGHPAPLLFRDGVGRPLPRPDGVLLGAASGAVYKQGQAALLPGDMLLLHTEGLIRRGGRSVGPEALLDLAPRFAQARTAQDCVRCVVEEFGTAERPDDACVLAARIGG